MLRTRVLSSTSAKRRGSQTSDVDEDGIWADVVADRVVPRAGASPKLL